MTDILYAARGGPQTTSDLYTVDPSTAVMTPIGPIGFALTALMFNPAGVLYGFTSNQSAVGTRSLVQIDTATGAGTLIGALGLGSATLADAAFDSSGNLWGWDSIGGGLVSVNIATGAGTRIGAISGDFSGAFDFDQLGVLWHIGGKNHFSETIDLVTGAATHVAAMSTIDFMQAGKYDASGTFWASRQVGASGSTLSRLVTVNPLSGVVSDIANFSLSSVDALAWSGALVPHPRGIFDGGPAYKQHA